MKLRTFEFCGICGCLLTSNCEKEAGLCLECFEYEEEIDELHERIDKLSGLLKDFLEWYDYENADECKLDEFLKLFREALK